jgi:hypothetical protein
MGVTSNAKEILMWKSFEKWLLGRLTRRWEDNIKVCLKEIHFEDERWMTRLCLMAGFVISCDNPLEL